jgi:glycosyltransferase
MSMLVSIITVTYNSAATIEETMLSVGKQDYPLIEHIIVDGQSTDDTLSKVREFKHNIRIICEKDQGIYDAMNKGIQAAQGDIIGILNSDDHYAHAGVISRVADVFRDDAVQTCYADLQYFNAHNPRRITRTWKSGHFRQASFYWGWMPPHPTFFVRKSVYDRVGLFHTHMPSAADYEMMLRILLKNGMNASYIPEVLVKMRTGGVSNASWRNRLRANRDDRQAWKLNKLRPRFFTLYLKPLRKLMQFVKK